MTCWSGWFYLPDVFVRLSFIHWGQQHTFRLVRGGKARGHSCAFPKCLACPSHSQSLFGCGHNVLAAAWAKVYMMMCVKYVTDQKTSRYGVMRNRRKYTWSVEPFCQKMSDQWPFAIYSPNKHSYISIHLICFANWWRRLTITKQPRLQMSIMIFFFIMREMWLYITQRVRIKHK